MIESTAVEDALNAAEVVRRSRDIAITTAIGISVIPVLYVVNLVLLQGNGPVLVTGYTVETTIAFIVSLVLLWRLVTTAVGLNRLLKDQDFLCRSGPSGSAHVFLLRQFLKFDG